MDFESSSGNLNNTNVGRSANSSYITDASPASSKSRSPSGLGGGGGTSQINYVSILIS